MPAGPARIAGPTTELNHDHSPASAAQSASLKPGSPSGAEASYRSFASRPAAAA